MLEVMNFPGGEDLLPIWDLDINDINFLTPPSSWTASHSEGCVPRVSSISPSERSFQHTKLCTDCHGLNASDTNWCTECGVALIGHSSDAGGTGASIDSRTPETVVKSSLSFCNEDVLDLPKPIERHWKTSKSYSWRKPSSIPISMRENASSPSESVRENTSPVISSSAPINSPIITSSAKENTLPVVSSTGPISEQKYCVSCTLPWLVM